MIYSTETGLVPNPLLVGVGLADSGTQLTASFAGIPAGVQLSVPSTITNGTLTVVAVTLL